MKTYYPPPSSKKGNELKTEVQQDIPVKLEAHGALVLEAATGFGKTFAGLSAINHINPTDTLIIVPTLTLKEQWQSVTVGFSNVDVVVINTHVFHANSIVHHGLVIVDEGHRILNSDSQWFSTALDSIDEDNLLILSATLSKDHYDFLKIKRPTIALYKINLAWCFKHGLIPEHVNINIPVSLTLEEKSQIIKIQNEYEKYSRFFAGFNIFNPYIDYGELDFIASDVQTNVVNKPKSDQTKGQLIGMMNKWRKSTNDRKAVYQNAVNKHYILNDFLQRIRDEKPQKCLIFAKSIDTVEQIKINNSLDATCYHSKHNEKQKREIFREFFSNERPFLASINTIIEGFDMVNYAQILGITVSPIQLAFRMSYDSNDLKTIQTLGRILRYNPENPDQRVIQVNVYVDDFSIRGKEYKSQEKKWLIKNLQSQISIEWLNSVDDIVL